MAPRMRLWTGLLLAGIAFISVGRLPPTSFTAEPPEGLTPQEVRARALTVDIRRAEGILKRIRWSDRIVADLFENAENGLGIEGGGRMTDEAIGGYRDHIERTLEALPARDPEALVGVYWVDVNEGHYRELVPLAYRSSTEYYIGEHQGTPYCIDLHAGTDNYLDDSRIRHRPFRDQYGPWAYGSGVGACRLVAQYGMPGDQILEWLGEGGLAFGYGTRVADRNYGDYFGRRGLFGRSSWSAANQRIGLDRCMAGQSEACLELVMHPASARIRGSDEREIEVRSPLTTMIQGTSLRTPGAMIFDDLETQFGSGAFDRFWSSDLGVEESFEAAFGVSLGDWAVSWMHDNLGEFQSGPALTRSARFGGLFTIMLFGLLAAAWQRRRKVA